MNHPPLKVLQTPPATSDEALDFFSRKLRHETDPSDVYHDIQTGNADFVLVDVRSSDSYRRSHIPWAVSIPANEITAQRMAEYPDDTIFVVYCWGPGCNGATKAAVKLSTLGRAVKEMIGGIEYWEDRERYPVERNTDEQS
ncbi:MAG TPA: rhodanese-like domain-containing protein [Aggregatilineales bacterium]|nr:rhodanese-like domain-containing protein [Aggregatilineales bacterium]